LPLFILKFISKNMEAHFNFISKRINYSELGQGCPVVLVHGYLESSKIWTKFSEQLSRFSHTIAIDLPGHGKSDLITDCSMEIYADAMNGLLLHLQIEKAIIIGHSMGGYAALAFTAKYPHKTQGLCLFHSKPFADSSEKMIQRDFTSSKIKAGAYEEVVNSHVASIFAQQNVLKFQKEIEENRNHALEFPIEGVIESLRSMKNRKDYTEMMKNMQIPLLYIYGRHDILIPENEFTMIEFAEHHLVEVLENSGHAGFLEEPEKSVAILKRFIENCQ